MLPITAITVAMILVRSPGTSTSDPLGFVMIVLAPPATFVAGIALLRRMRWAWFYMVTVLSVVVVASIYQFLFAPTASFTYLDQNGVRTTVVTRDKSTFAPAIVIGTGLLLVLLTRRSRGDFFARKNPPPPVVTGRQRDWRVGHRGRDAMYYEEVCGGAWQRIEIDGEMLTGRAHHVIYFASPEKWQSYPEWARLRRDEIIARIKSELREPDYEYLESSVAHPYHAPIESPARPAREKGFGALIVAVVALLAVSGWMFCIVMAGIDVGEIRLPVKQSAQRLVSRQQKPAMFWTSVGIYSAIGLGTFGVAVWGVAAGRKR